jgi:hypothetical protein
MSFDEVKLIRNMLNEDIETRSQIIEKARKKIQYDLSRLQDHSKSLDQFEQRMIHIRSSLSGLGSNDFESPQNSDFLVSKLRCNIARYLL